MIVAFLCEISLMLFVGSAVIGLVAAVIAGVLRVLA